jgi:SAM-dependent methyltransferase
MSREAQPQHERDEAILNDQVAYYRARAEEYDQWFLREGRYDRGAEHRAEWFCEIDLIRRSLTNAIRGCGDVLELACGTGLWTGQLARENRRVVAVDASPEVIGINRRRVGESPEESPESGRVTGDERVTGVERVEAGSPSNVRYEIADIFTWRSPQRFDAVFFAFWLSHVPPTRFERFWEIVRAALNPGGKVFFVDSLFEPTSTAKDHPPVDDSGVVRRRLNDGREFDIVKVFYQPATLEARLAQLGWHGSVRASGRFFLFGSVGR